MTGKLQSTQASEGTAEESSEQPSQQHQNNNPLQNIISHFIEHFNSIFSQHKKKNNKAVENKNNKAVEKKNNKAVEKSADVNDLNTEAESTVVRFPLAKYESFPSVKLESDEIQERNTNPVLLWQAYAIGGLLVLMWGWTRWNERRTRKKPSNDQPPPAP